MAIPPDEIQRLITKYTEVPIIHLSWRLEGRVSGITSPRYGVSSLVKTKQGDYLLVQQTYSLPGIPAGTWTTPGGKVEAGEGFEDAAVREILEEIRNNARIVSLYKIFHHTHIFVDGVEAWWMPIFIAEADSEPRVGDPHEILSVDRFSRLPEGFAGELGVYYSDLN